MTEFNKNMLSPVGFSLDIKKAPIFSFFVQSVVVPGLNLGYTEHPTPFKAIPIYGDHNTVGDMDVVFKINEDLSNYIEIFDWMKEIGFPEDFAQHKSIAERLSYTGAGIESDATLIIMSSAMNPVCKVEFENVFPIALSPFEMTSKDTNIEYIEVTATFKVKMYNFVQY